MTLAAIIREAERLQAAARDERAKTASAYGIKQGK
jgi:hypothetical protein